MEAMDPPLDPSGVDRFAALTASPSVLWAEEVGRGGLCDLDRNTRPHHPLPLRRVAHPRINWTPIGPPLRIQRNVHHDAKVHLWRRSEPR
jgi:hypothetical protein